MLFYAWHRIRTEWPIVGGDLGYLDITIICSVAFFVATSRLLRLPLRRRRRIVPRVVVRPMVRAPFLLAFAAVTLVAVAMGTGPGPLFSTAGLVVALSFFLGTILFTTLRADRGPSAAIEAAASIAFAVVSGIPGLFVPVCF